MFFYTQDPNGKITSYVEVPDDAPNLEEEKEGFESVGFIATHRQIISLSDGTMVFKTDVSKETLEQEEAKRLKAERQNTVSMFELEVEQYLNQVAQSRGYKDMDRLISWKDSEDPQWKKEAEAGIRYRDEVWKYANAIINSYLADEMEMLDIELVKLDMPQIDWGDE